ncbi:DUF6588 family protein [Tenuifilum thalassicum]|uniref:Outer membrane protein beta-barrel domain-containing protein n=1 Tax=Tenuifilum thalassicum TaxID=2590900 RepID=A0A7D3XZM9_9BACT|nr:DUF6588 family protein [Tenuifilum thalassicum]QKG79973.1 hypothetical protein FHG85_06750 [Tenuifilum thalassicum]
MKKFKGLVLASILLVPIATFSQEDVVDFLSGSLNDANKLSKAYLEPFGKSLGMSLNSGWYNSANPHGLLGFDITFTMPITIPVSSDKTFNINDLNLEYWEVKTGSSSTTPTVVGGKSSSTVLTDKLSGTAELNVPGGANLQFIPAPIIQVAKGLPFNTEIVGRYFPKVNISGVGNFGLWGIGIKNEFKEYIPFFKRLPFSMSVFVGYTQFTSTFDINKAQKQKLEFKSSGYTARLLVSKSIPVLTVYGGLGYNHSKTDISVLGTYNTADLGTLTDPISLNFANNGFAANLGLRLKLAILAFHFDYSLGEYGIFNAGVGINFR